MRLAVVGVDVERIDDGALGAVGLTGGPGLDGQRLGARLGHVDGLHDLAQHAVAQQHHGVAVLVRQVKRGAHQVHRLLHVGRGKADQAVVAVSAAAGGLEVVGLRRLDGAKAGAAAHHVDHNKRELRAHRVGDALLLERDSRAGGRGHHARARAGRAVDHVDGADLGLGLQEAAAHLGHALGHVFGDLVLGRDGIAEEEAASGEDGGFRNGLVALHKYLCHVGIALLIFLP